MTFGKSACRPLVLFEPSYANKKKLNFYGLRYDPFSLKILYTLFSRFSQGTFLNIII